MLLSRLTHLKCNSLVVISYSSRKVYNWAAPGWMDMMDVFFSFFSSESKQQTIFCVWGGDLLWRAIKVRYVWGKIQLDPLDNHNLKLCDHRLGYAKQIDSWRFRWKAMATEGRRHEFACWNGHITSCFLGKSRLRTEVVHPSVTRSSTKSYAKTHMSGKLPSI